MESELAISGLKVLMHQIYEFEKGVRNMVLCTLSDEELKLACQRLDKRNIAYFTQLTPRADRCNLFFGKAECLEAIRHFIQNKDLHKLSAEEDFILGSLLGYDLCLQCKRYCQRRQIGS